MKKAYIVLLIFTLFAATLNAQKQLTTNQIPDSLFGAYQNQRGSWDFDFTPELFKVSGYPTATVQGAMVNGNVYTLNMKANDEETGNYQLTVKQIARDTIQLFDLNDTSVYYTYTRVGPDRIKYPLLSYLLDKVKGKWYFTDGTNEMYIDFKDDYVVAPDGKWYYKTYAAYQGWMHQLNITGPNGEGTYLKFLDMVDNYMSLDFLGKGYSKLKKFSDIPDEPSITLNELPFSFDGKWYSCVDNSQVQFDGYFINPGSKKILAKKLIKEDDMAILSYVINDITKTLRIQQTDNSNYIRVTDEKGKVSFYRNDKKLAAGMPVKPNASGEWFNLKTGEMQAKISEGELIVDGKNIAYNNILFDGQNYKFYNNNSLEASLQILSENNSALSLAGNTQLMYLKRTSGLPSHIVLDALPDDLYQNWLHPTTGEWLAGFMRNKVIYKANNWKYGEIVYTPTGDYLVNLMRVDTVCTINDQGVKLCKLVERHDAIRFTLQNDRYTFTLNNYNNISLVNSIYELDYQPTAQLPEPKTGTAVLRVQYLGNAPDVAGREVKVHSNNAWFMDQLSYTTTFNEEGYAMLEVPMAQAQPVYASIKNFGRIFLSPGDTLYAAFNDEWAEHFEKAIWMGKHAQINYDIGKYDFSYWGMGEFTRESETLLNKPIDEYEEARKALTDKITNRDKEFFQTTSCSPAFIELTEINNQVQEWDDLMRYQWLPERYRSNPPQFPAEYFDFLKEIDFSNSKYWYSENMAWFLNEVSRWLSSSIQPDRLMLTTEEILLSILNSDTEIPDSTRKAMHAFLDYQKVKLGDRLLPEVTQELYNSLKIDSVSNSMENKQDFNLIDYYRKNQTAYTTQEFETIANWMESNEGLITSDVRSLMNSYMNNYYTELQKRTFTNNLELITNSGEVKEMFSIMRSLSEFSYTLQNLNEKAIKAGFAQLRKLDIPPAVMEIVNDKYQETLSVFALPMPGNADLQTVASGGADEFMAKLVQKHAGKVVYIDVWAPWCAPCRGEFPYTPKLKKKLEGKDVAFVYICGSGEKSAWENCIKQYQLNGDHYFIDNKIYSELQKKYAIHGIPRFMIMDKQGNIVDLQASRPSQLEETTRRLSAHL